MSSAAMQTTTTSPAAMSDRKAGAWAGLTSFFLMWSFLYIVLVVFRPSWVCVARVGTDAILVRESACKESVELDQGRAFVVSLVITLVVMLVVWLVMATAK